MKYLYAMILLASTIPAWADCHYADNYGIYKICDPPRDQNRHGERHEDHHRDAIQTVFVTAPQPVPITTFDDSRRDLTTVDNKLHQLHLLLIDKQNRGDVSADFFEEENRYLAQVERREQSEANANGGYLTLAQENALLQQLQDIEAELNS